MSIDFGALSYHLQHLFIYTVGHDWPAAGPNESVHITRPKSAKAYRFPQLGLKREVPWV